MKINGLPHLNGNSSDMKDFVVCLKEVFLPFQDQSVQLAEWLELQRLLGASKVMVFVTGDVQHPNVSKVLRFVLIIGANNKKASVLKLLLTFSYF